MVSSTSHDSTTNCINHLPVVMETREALYKLCGIYYHNKHVGSHDPIITEILNKILPERISVDQWAATMATKKKHK